MNIFTDIIYLNISGFSIKLYFNKTEQISLRKKFQKEILTSFNKFITKSEPKKVNFKLYFIEKKNVIITNNKSLTSIQLYKTRTDHTFITYYYISLIQFTLIIRYILIRLLENNGLLIHVSACLKDGKTYIFLGESGAGKSTIVQLLKLKYPTLADDIGIIKEENNTLYFYQTPFIERNNLFNKSSKRYPLGKIFFLRKTKYCRITRIDNKEHIIQKIISQIWMDRTVYKKEGLVILFNIISKFDKYYMLSFTKNRAQLISLFENI